MQETRLSALLLYTIALTHKCKYTLILEVYYDTKIKDMSNKLFKRYGPVGWLQLQTTGRRTCGVPHIFKTDLAQLDFSKNPNKFIFWSQNRNTLKKLEQEYIFIKFYGIAESIYFRPNIWEFASLVTSIALPFLTQKGGANPFIWSESLRIQLWPRIGIHFIFCRRIRVDLPGGRSQVEPNSVCRVG